MLVRSTYNLKGRNNLIHRIGQKTFCSFLQESEKVVSLVLDDTPAPMNILQFPCNSMIFQLQINGFYHGSLSVGGENNGRVLDPVWKIRIRIRSIKNQSDSNDVYVKCNANFFSFFLISIDQNT